MIGLQFDHTAQTRLHQVHAVDAFGKHRGFVEQAGVVRRFAQGVVDHQQCLCRAVGVAQDLHLGEDVSAHGRGFVGLGLQQGARLVDAALARDALGAADVGLGSEFRVRDLVEPLPGGLTLAAVCGDLPEMEADQVGLRVLGCQCTREVDFGFCRLVQLQR